ncbi:MAG: hypothetical protein OJF49_001811 [Ktedonobacterales bacterium]|nr:MAG: hypothetical protein OJF49_001811 [Ktedonobacterales bacterium]
MSIPTQKSLLIYAFLRIYGFAQDDATMDAIGCPAWAVHRFHAGRYNYLVGRTSIL